MLTDELKSTVSDLSKEEREELEHYLLKIRLENDSEYWERIRRKTGSYTPSANNRPNDSKSVA